MYVMKTLYVLLFLSVVCRLWLEKDNCDGIIIINFYLLSIGNFYSSSENQECKYCLTQKSSNDSDGLVKYYYF